MNMKEKINKIPLLLFIPVILISNSCNKTEDEIFPKDPVHIDLTSDQVAIISSENTFAFDIFKEVLKNAGNSENVIISPLSISYALSMTLNGAVGATRDSMLKALRISGMTPDKINNSYSSLTESLLSVDKRVIMKIANSVWTEKNFSVKKQFIDILTNYYKAESKAFDINDQAAPDKINAWIEDNTNGLIKNMIDKLDDNSVMLLINAIYFKGKWKSEFNVDNTVQRSFFKTDGSTIIVPMMKQQADFKIFTGENFILAEFPYGQGNFVMDVILPNEQNLLDPIIQNISENDFSGWINGLHEKKMSLFFPRYKYKYKLSLKEILTTMGMGITFTDNADFSNISDLADLLINDVAHQAFIETNEEGTEAAAATVVVIGITSVGPEPLTLNLDHPFIYVIRETTTNSILFMGKVADPLAN